MFGWTGSILRINLTDGTAVSEPINEQYAHECIGRRALAMKYHSVECGSDTEPFSEDNKVVFMTGPLTGTLGIGTAHFSIFAGKALTNDRAGPEYGDHFGAELKYAGFDGLIVEGIAESPVYLEITDEGARLLPANAIWGCSTSQSAKFITAAIGPGARACLIGPAGEKLSPISCAVTDGGTAIGHGGIGAVMGSKRFKGVVVRGTNAIRVAEPAAYIDSVLFYRRKLAARAKIFQLSTAPITAVTTLLNGKEYLFKRHKACFSCFIGCRYDLDAHGAILPCPTPEAIMAFASVGVEDAASIIDANRLCLDYGLRPETCGRAVAHTIKTGSPNAVFDNIEAFLRQLAGIAGWSDRLDKQSGPAQDLISKSIDYPELDFADSPALLSSADALGLCPLCTETLAEEELGKQFHMATGLPEGSLQEAAERAALLERLYTTADTGDE